MKILNAIYARKSMFMLLLVFVAASITISFSLTSAEPNSEKFPDYFAIKGGLYYPSERISVDEFSPEDLDRKKGVNAEIALGHYYVPFFGTEFGVGYIENRRFPATATGRTRLEALPVLLSAKLFLPLGPIEPYGEVGIGAYFTKLEVESVAGTSTARDVEFGPHAGVGLNINFTDTFYLGLEGRYRKVKPEYDGGRTVRLDGYTATANLGFRY